MTPPHPRRSVSHWLSSAALRTLPSPDGIRRVGDDRADQAGAACTARWVARDTRPPGARVAEKTVETTNSKWGRIVALAPPTLEEHIEGPRRRCPGLGRPSSVEPTREPVWPEAMDADTWKHRQSRSVVPAPWTAPLSRPDLAARSGLDFASTLDIAIGNPHHCAISAEIDSWCFETDRQESVTMIELTRVAGVDAARPCDALSREYMDWLVGRLHEVHDIVIPPAEVEEIHAALASEITLLLQDPGRLYLVTDGSNPVGMGILKPVGPGEGEIKRMYVRPEWRGRAIGRMVFERLLEDARTLGYRSLRLETFGFMSAAVAMYEAHGFTYTDPFAGHEGAEHGVARVQLFMSLDLD
ncbi:MAG: GNAT family N-acetyltransferase [Acidimicrobiia bacterium]|nr:GNAT family N-acetyltransferase [Acidimicrobiia bacterium]